MENFAHMHGRVKMTADLKMADLHNCCFFVIYFPPTNIVPDFTRIDYNNISFPTDYYMLEGNIA